MDGSQLFLYQGSAQCLGYKIIPCSTVCIHLQHRLTHNAIADVSTILLLHFSMPGAPAEAAAVEEPPKAPTPPPPAGKVKVQTLQCLLTAGSINCYCKNENIFMTKDVFSLF